MNRLLPFYAHSILAGFGCHLSIVAFTQVAKDLGVAFPDFIGFFYGWGWAIALAAALSACIAAHKNGFLSIFIGSASLLTVFMISSLPLCRGPMSLHDDGHYDPTIAVQIGGGLPIFLTAITIYAFIAWLKSTPASRPAVPLDASSSSA